MIVMVSEKLSPGQPHAQLHVIATPLVLANCRFIDYVHVD